MNRKAGCQEIRERLSLWLEPIRMTTRLYFVVNCCCRSREKFYWKTFYLENIAKWINNVLTEKGNICLCLVGMSCYLAHFSRVCLPDATVVQTKLQSQNQNIVFFKIFKCFVICILKKNNYVFGACYFCSMNTECAYTLLLVCASFKES